MTRDPVAVFEQERPRLQAIAYAMTGQIMEAEDAVQDAWLRWQKADHGSITNPAAWLTTVVSRLAIDRLRSARHRREVYVGPWLPEPIVSVTGPGDRLGDDPADQVAEAELLSMAFVAALERLNPVDRAVLVLREVFDLDYTDIAAVVNRSPDNCRQIARRARDRVGESGRAQRPTPARQHELTQSFVAALASGDLDQLQEILAADVILWSDGGGRTRAALHPILGVDRVARFLLGIRKQVRPGDRMAFVGVNGDPGLYLQRDGHPYAVLCLQTSHEAITAVHTVVNPDKLVRLSALDAPLPVQLD